MIMSSDGRSEVVDGYEEGLNLARRWRQAASARRSGNHERISGPLPVLQPRADSGPFKSDNSRPASLISAGEFRDVNTGSSAPTVTVRPSAPAAPPPADRWSQPTQPTERWSQPTKPSDRWSQPTQPAPGTTPLRPSESPTSRSSPAAPSRTSPTPVPTPVPERWPRATLPQNRPPHSRPPRTARPPLTRPLPLLRPEEPELSTLPDGFPRLPRSPLEAPTEPDSTVPAHEPAPGDSPPPAGKRKSLWPFRR